MKGTNTLQLYRLIYYSYMIRAMFLPIIRSTCVYLQYLVVFTQVVQLNQDTSRWLHLVGCFHNYIRIHLYHFYLQYCIVFTYFV